MARRTTATAHTPIVQKLCRAAFSQLFRHLMLTWPEVIYHQRHTFIYICAAQVHLNVCFFPSGIFVALAHVCVWDNRLLVGLSVAVDAAAAATPENDLSVCQPARCLFVYI